MVNGEAIHTDRPGAAEQVVFDDGPPPGAGVAAGEPHGSAGAPAGDLSPGEVKTTPEAQAQVWATELKALREALQVAEDTRLGLGHRPASQRPPDAYAETPPWAPMTVPTPVTEIAEPDPVATAGPAAPVTPALRETPPAPSQEAADWAVERAELKAALETAEASRRDGAAERARERAKIGEEHRAEREALSTRIRDMETEQETQAQTWRAQRTALEAKIADLEAGHTTATELWSAERSSLIEAKDEERRAERATLEASLRGAERQQQSQIEMLKEECHALRKAAQAHELSGRESAEAAEAERARLAEALEAAQADARSHVAERDSLEATLRRAWAEKRAAAEEWADKKTRLASAAKAVRAEADARAAERDELASALREAQEQHKTQTDAWVAERETMRAALETADARWQQLAEEWGAERDLRARQSGDGEAQPVASREGDAASAPPPLELSSDVQIRVDGYPAKLVSLSQTGAQLMVPTTLQCNQQVELTLVGRGTHRVRAGVVSAVPGHTGKTGRLWHRVALLFVDADPTQMGSFCADC